MDNGVITTATSQSEGRLKVGAGSMNERKKKFLKKTIGGYKKDSKGGPGLADPTYGAPPAQMNPSILQSSIRTCEIGALIKIPLSP